MYNKCDIFRSVRLNEMSRFWSTDLTILDYETESVVLYIVLLFVYSGILVGQHYLQTATHQLHREALTIKANRPLGKLVGYNIMRTVVHVINVVFISSNNFGMLVVSVFGHALGVYFVYRSQRADHKHPIRSLLNALKNPHDAATKEDIASLLRFIRDNKTKF